MDSLCLCVLSAMCLALQLSAVRRQRQDGLTEAQVTVGRAGSNLLGLWPVHFCGNSWAESKTEVGWASPELWAIVRAGTPAPPPLSVSILETHLHVAAQCPFLTASATHFPELEDTENAVSVTNMGVAQG